MEDHILEIKNLKIKYKLKSGYLYAVKDVSFNVKKGEMVAVVGESGCGKSTIANAIMQLPVDGEIIEGEILVNGRDLNRLSEKEMESVRGKEIGMIFQNPLDSLNPVYKTRSQITEALKLDHIGKKEADAIVEKLFSSVRMPDPRTCMNSYPHELSGGMRQRVMIAMMIARNPQFLIADEPTTALDVTVETQIMDILNDMKKTRNTSILLITHNFGLVAESADRIVVMYAGQVVEQGTVYEIFDNPVHPYTHMLMKALPRKTKKEGRLVTIDGAVPKIKEDVPGCHFANRCPFAREKCFCETPDVQLISGEHSFRCHIQKEELQWEKN